MNALFPPLARLLVVVACLSSTGCSLLRDPVSRYVNRNWPPVDIGDQRAAAIASAARTLGEIPAPDLAFGTPLAAVERVLMTPELEQLGVRSLRLRGEEQLLRVDVGFQRKFSAEELAGSELLRQLEPEVAGVVRVHAGITSATTQGKTTLLDLRILPVFSGLTIDRVRVRGEYDVTALGQALASLLNTYASNLTGVLARLPVMQVAVPTTIEKGTDAIHLRNEDPDVTVGGQPVHSPVALRGVGWLITGDAIAGIAQTVPVQVPPPAAAAAAAGAADGAAAPGYPELREAFTRALRESFDPPRLDRPWVGMRKELLAYITNSVVQQAALCATADGALPRQELSEQVRFPDESSVDCTPTRNCSPTRACDFTPRRDTRDCNTCLLWRPGWPLGDGGCAQRGNDPFCEAAKAAQNKFYEAEALGKKLDCERLKETERLVCEAEKAGEKALCETGKELLKRLARTGKFARIEASVEARAEDLRVCIQKFTLAAPLDRAEVTLRVTGGAVADIDLRFVPLDIVGHLACQVPWTDSHTFQASLRESDLTFHPRIRLVTDDGAQLRVNLPAGKVPLRLQPGPTEYILTNLNLTLSCHGLNLIKPLLIGATPFVPQLRGDIDYSYRERELAIDLPVPTQHIGGRTVTGAFQQSQDAVFLTGDVSP